MIVTYLTALLLAEGKLEYCGAELAKIQDFEPARALGKAIEEHRAGLNWWQRFLYAMGGKVKHLKLNFEPGVWLDLPDSAAD